MNLAMVPALAFMVESGATAGLQRIPRPHLRRTLSGSGKHAETLSNTSMANPSFGNPS